MGRMGKPQKSRKHKKMKPTFDQSNDGSDFSFGNGRNKMQNLPVKDEDLDRQDMPRKLKDMIHNRNKQNTGGIEKVRVKPSKNKKKKLKKAAAAASKLMNEGAKKEIKPIPSFVQGKNEKDRNFIRRVELQAHNAILQSKMERKYNVKFDGAGSNAQIQKELCKKKSSKNKREKDKERKKKKVEGKKEKKRDRAGDFSAFKDEVEFGEVAMAPPTLTAKPRKAESDDEKPRPGKRTLLLKDMMNKTEDTSTSEGTSNKTEIKNHPKSLAQRLAGQTLKRKYLSPVQKQITDFQRQKAIDLYRQMKDSKLKQK